MKRSFTDVGRSRRRVIAATAALWIAVVVASLAWEWVQTGVTARKFAEMEARTAFERDMTYRRWITMHGGVYVPATAKTPPNPYLLEIPARDVVTRDGKRLTLLNPAYMTREVNDLSARGPGLRIHITGLRPVRPENAPDPWEAKALRTLETGGKEVVSVEPQDGASRLRLMRPLVGEPGCIKCHGKQGHKVGDIFGGISVSVPYAPYLTESTKGWRQHMMVDLLIGVLGLAGLWAGNVFLRRSERSLEESERIFRDQFEQHAAVKLIVDPATGGIVDVNQAAARFYGWPRERLREMKIAEINTLPEEEIRKKLAEVDSGDRVHFEFRHRRADGSVRDVEVYSTKIRSKERGLLYSIVHDVTERKRAEEEVARTALEWQRTFDATNDAIWILDREQRVVRANKATERIFPEVNSGFLGRHCFELVHGTSAPIPGCPFQRSRETLRREEMELRIGDRWVEIVVDPILDDEGRFNGAVHIVTDITTRKLAEEEKERLHAERMQTDKMESIGRLAGGVAHDFNNMLMVILAHSEMALLNVAPEDPLRTPLVEIRKAAERSADLTRQMLAFARKQAVAPRVLDLNATVEGVLSMLRRVIGEEIAVAWLPQAGVQRVKMDPGQIDQILMNLCVNARDAIAGIGKVTIRTESASLDPAWCALHRGATPGEYVVLGLSDDGSGMEKETLGRIFEPFFTTKEAGKGTGLGLATVYGIVKQNNGFIEVDSAPGKGTTFRIYIPRYAGEVAEDAAAHPPDLPRGRGETVLLVEDEPVVLSMEKSMLESLGYSVLAAGSPSDAISIAGEHPNTIDLLMTDVVMPGMNGKELAGLLCAARPAMKCLFTSGYTADIIAIRGVLETGIAFLQKPFQMKGLAAKLREVLGG